MLITTRTPDTTLGEGVKRRYARLIEAASALANSTAPYKTILRDDGCEVRELDEREEALLEHVCHMLGKTVERVDG